MAQPSPSVYSGRAESASAVFTRAASPARLLPSATCLGYTTTTPDHGRFGNRPMACGRAVGVRRPAFERASAGASIYLRPRITA